LIAQQVIREEKRREEKRIAEHRRKRGNEANPGKEGKVICSERDLRGTPKGSEGLIRPQGKEGRKKKEGQWERGREGRNEEEGRGTDTPMDGKEGKNEGGRKRELKQGILPRPG
jgi:hypothetical protein